MIRKFTQLFIVFFFCCSSTFYSQLVNPSFEEWENTIYLNPVGWTTLNLFIEAVTQSSDAQDGSYSAKMEIMEYFGERFEPTIQNDVFGQYVGGRVGKVNFYYKADFKNFSALEFYVTTWDSNTTTQQLTPSGSGDIIIKNSTNSWTYVEVPIEYFSTDDEPAYAYLAFALLDSTDSNTDLSAVGSYAMIDNVSFDFVTDIETSDEIPLQFSLKQNYPNPFNPTTKINYSIAAPSFVQLKIYDILGNEVKELVNEYQNSGSYIFNFNGSDLSSGTYIMQLKAGEYLQSKKILLLK